LAVVAQRAGIPIGAACLFSDDSLPGFEHLTPWLAAVYVAEESRRQGVGRALVERIVAEARRLGHAQLYLWTGSEAGWYERQGWQRIAATTFFGQPIDVMARET
jgi:N-acetylglutamate synthase-like GNAT family acetyltransferase